MSKATIPQPFVMEFKLDTGKVFKEVKHYHLIKGSNIFSEKVNISINRGYSRAYYTYSLKIWTGRKWSKQITGLFPTHHPDIFYGDTMNKKNLLLVRFFEDGKKLRFFFFKNYYTRELPTILKAIKNHL